MNTILILNNWNNVILHIYNKSINSWTIKIYENFLRYNSIIWILFRTTLFRNCYIFNYKFRLFAKVENFPQTLLYWSPILKLGEASRYVHASTWKIWENWYVCVDYVWDRLWMIGDTCTAHVFLIYRSLTQFTRKLTFIFPHKFLIPRDIIL